MNIFGLTIIHTSEYDSLHAIRRDLTAAIDSSRSLASELSVSNHSLQKTLAKANEELLEARNKIISLDKENAQLAKNLDQMSAREATAQDGRIEHNDVLRKVGQAWVDLKAALRFRDENPKMTPMQRLDTKAKIADAVEGVDKLLPKQIPDPHADGKVKAPERKK